MNLPDLGVGITFFPDIAAYLTNNQDLIDVLLIEPQTFWYHAFSKNIPYQMNMKLFENIKRLPYKKIVHGVSNPIGGSSLPDASQIPLFVQTINDLNVPWASEHLSFNKFQGLDGYYNTGFLLPPRQTSDGVEYAVQSIVTLSRQLPVPLAIETGVNYLKPRSDEMSDGEFVSRVVESADCGIILDMHNIWTNELNGRQTVNNYLDDLPIERIWELHLAGGDEEDGYWLDAHSGRIPTPLIDITRSIIPHLPNLHAIIFELYPTYFSYNNYEAISEQLKELRKLWDLRNGKKCHGACGAKTRQVHKNTRLTPSSQANTLEWESTLGALVIGQQPVGKLGEELTSDPAITVYKKLVESFRASNIARTLTLSYRLLVPRFARNV